MPFTKPVITPTKITEIRILLRSAPAPDGTMDKDVFYEVTLLDQNGNKIETPSTRGNLAPHITMADKVWLADFMDRLRAQAVAQFIG